MGEYTKPTINFGTLSRPTILRVPNGWKPSKKYPLILFLHNYDADNGNHSTDSGGLSVRGRMDMDQCATFDDGCFSLVPNGTADSLGKLFWNASSACCDRDFSGVDDATYLVNLVQSVINTWNVDTRFVVAAGYSNGAFMAHKLACFKSDLFTHVLSVAGAFVTSDGTGCTTVRNVAVVEAHGDGDTTVPYNGGIGQSPLSQTVAVCSAAQTVGYWATKNGSGGSLQAAYDTIDLITTGNPSGSGAECSRQAYSGCPSDGQVELWTLTGAFHSMIFSTGAGMRMTSWALTKPRS
jgi:polyhydroxybutyrate depolymerase